MGPAGCAGVWVGPMRWPVMGLQRHREIRRLEVLGRRYVRREGQMLRVVLTLGLRPTAAVGRTG